MSLLRAFIAIEIPFEIKKAIDQQVTGLKAALTDSLVRWVPASNQHLTLKFLGDVSPQNLPALTKMLSTEASRQGIFEVQIGGMGVFPNSRRPRVIWIGIQAPPQLKSLQHGLETACAKLGYPSENRPFSPHLTVGRVRQHVSASDQQKIRAALDATHIGSLDTVKADAIHLYQSELKPGGAIYTLLFSAPFNQQLRGDH